MDGLRQPAKYVDEGDFNLFLLLPGYQVTYRKVMSKTQIA